MKDLYSALLASAFLLLLSGPAEAQNSSCFSLRVGQVTGLPGDIVSVPVQAAGTLDDLVSAQFALTWNPADLHYAVPQLDFGNNPLNLDGQFFNVTQQGSLRFAWYDLLLIGVPVVPGDTLFMINLQIQPGASGYLPIVLNNEYPGIPLEVGNLTGIVPTGALDGGIQVGAGGGTPLLIEEACQYGANCAAPYGSISLTLNGGTPPYAYSWIGPSGPMPGDDNLSAAGAGQYFVTVTDQAGATVSGAFTLQSQVTFLSIFPTELQQPTCQGNDGLIEVEAINGVPPYTYSWSTAALGPIQSSLSAGFYAVTVTDATGCTSDATFNLYETSGFSLQTALQKPHCGQADGSLSVTPVGFSPPFQYLWNTGATISSISGIGAGVYSVTATNAEGCAESKTIWVGTTGPNEGWIHDETFDCDTTSGHVDLTGIFWNAPGAVLPIQLNWGNGNAQTIDSLNNGTFFFQLADQPQGAHYVQVADSAGCATYVFFQAVCPGASSSDSLTTACLTLRSGQALPYSIYSSKECVPITVKGFDDISSLRFGLDWPADKYVFTNLREVKLSPFTPFDLNVFQDQGALLIDWQNPFGAGLSLPDGDTLFNVCFFNLAIPQAGSGLAFTDDFTPRATKAGGEEIGFVAFDGRFTANINTPASACSLSPDCLNDGVGGFFLNGVWWNDNDAIQLFQHGVQQWTGTTEQLTTLLPGTYRAQFPAAFNQTPQTGLFHLPQLVTEDCVWPGDADNNAAANHHDLLYLGLAYGSTGPARPAQLLNWKGQDGAAWNQRTALRKVNYKNMDTNGDGLVNIADTLAIVQNWGQVVNPAVDNPFDAPFGNQIFPIAPQLTLSPDTVVAGQVVSIPVLLGSPAVQVDSLHGLAFSVVYDPAMLQNEVYFQPVNSWLGNPVSDLIWLQRNFPEQGRLDVAVTRFDGQPAGGSGVIGYLFVIIEDDIFFQAPDGGPDFTPPGDTVKFTPLHLGNLQAVGPDEQPIALLPVDVNLPIRRAGASGTSQPAAWASGMSVWPNPAGNYLQITSEQAAMQSVELIAPDGKVFFRKNLPNVWATRLDLPDLPAGMYWVKIWTDKGIATQKVVLSAKN